MEDQTYSSNSQIHLNLPVDRDILFSNHKNVYKKGIEKRQTKLIKKIPFIKPFLRDSEKIFLLTTGCSPVSFLEQFLTGWIVFYLKRSLFVFTNKRIFHIPIKLGYSFRNSIAQILYADCQSIVLKRGTLVVVYKNGKKEKFLYIAGKERKKIKTLLDPLPMESEGSEKLERTHLCPRCTKELIYEKYTCPNCHLEFKDKNTVKKLSLLYPGGGYFYTRHPVLGISDALTEILLIFLLIISFVETLQGVEGSVFMFLFWSISLVIEKAVTVFHSNHFIKEYITEENRMIG